MKSGTYLLIALLFCSFSCSKNEPTLNKDSENICSGANKIVKEVENCSGMVYYNTDVKGFTIIYTVPNTYDSREVGIVCNLQEELQKDGQRVTYSGQYRAYGSQPLEKPAGSTFYYLNLTKVESGNQISSAAHVSV